MTGSLALLAGFFLFANPLGIFVRKCIGTAIKTTFFLAKKGIPALLRLIAANPLKSAAVLIPTLAAMVELNKQILLQQILKKQQRVRHN